jgi:hypothetical protein
MSTSSTSTEPSDGRLYKEVPCGNDVRMMSQAAPLRMPEAHTDHRGQTPPRLDPFRSTVN